MAVHRQQGPGYRENTYQRDLEVQFTESELAYVPQKLLEVYVLSDLVGTFKNR